jgi:capsular exopolysaccharide synthesis family protein
MINSNFQAQSDQIEFEQFDFQRYWFTIKRRWLPSAIVFSIAPVISLAAAFWLEPIYQATGSLVIKPDPSSNLVGLDVQMDPQPLVKGNTVFTEISVIKSVPVAQEVISSLELKDEEREQLKVEAFREKITIKNLPKSDVIELSYVNKNPELASEIVNKVLEVYIENNIVINRAEATAAREFITQQLPQIEAEVRQAEISLRRFEEENQIVSLDREANSMVDKLNAAKSDLTEAEARFSQSNARSDVLQSQLEIPLEQASQLVALTQSEAVQDILTEYQNIDSELATQLTRYDENHPKVQALFRQEVALKDLLIKRIAEASGYDGNLLSSEGTSLIKLADFQVKVFSDLLQAEVDKASALEDFYSRQQFLASQESRANAIPGLVEVHRQLERRLNTAQTTYNTLLSRQQEIRVAENQNIGNAAIISTALIPEEPVFPNKKLFLASGCLAGAALGLLTAFGLDLIDLTLKSIKEVRTTFPYPLLGVIPQCSDSRNQGDYESKNSERIVRKNEGQLPVFVRDEPRSSLSETFQILYTSLNFLSIAQNRAKRVLITSTIPGEGKSTISANLAAAAAYLGKRVLIIDSDMRRPTQHKKWGVDNYTGLSNILIGDASVKSSVKEVMKGLDILTVGTIPPNPLSLIEGGTFQALLEDVEENYDLIILDTPPLLSVADTLLISKFVDVKVLVARPYLLDYASARSAREKLKQINCDIDALIINGVRLDIDPYTYGYSNYYYGYSSQASKETKDVEESPGISSSSISKISPKI